MNEKDYRERYIENLVEMARAEQNIEIRNRMSKRNNKNPYYRASILEWIKEVLHKKMRKYEIITSWQKIKRYPFAYKVIYIALLVGLWILITYAVHEFR